MNLQIIKSIEGEVEYVLLPIHAYEALKPQIEQILSDSDYVPFIADDYVSNSVALARINANVTQEALATMLGVSQAYVSKLESQGVVSAKALHNVKKALSQKG